DRDGGGGMAVGREGGHRATQHEQPADRPEVAGWGLTPGQVEIAVMHAVLTECVGQQPGPLGLGVAKNEPERPLARGVVPAPACHAFPFPNRAPAVKARGEAWRGCRGVWYGPAAYGD